MNKRKFLLAMLATGVAALVAERYLPLGAKRPAPAIKPPVPEVAITDPGLTPTLVKSSPSEEHELAMLQQSELNPGFQHQERQQTSVVMIEQLPNETDDEYLEKIRNFEKNFPNDIYLSDANSKLLLPHACTS